MSTPTFVHLRLHGEFSVVDGTVRIDDAVRAYIVDRKKISDQLASLEAQMVELSVLRSTLARVTADADGYVTEVNVKPGEAFNPRAAAYSFSPKEEMPVLRVDAEKTTLAIAKGTKVTFTGKKGQVVAAFMVGLDDEIVAVSDGGVTIRMPVRDISSQGRDATGVRLMSLDNGQFVASVAPILASDDAEE